MPARFRSVAEGTITLATLVLLLRWWLTPTAATRRFGTSKALSVVRVLLVMALGRKLRVALKPLPALIDTVRGAKATTPWRSLLRVEITHAEMPAADVATFRRICGTSAEMAAYILPHVLGQRAMLSVMSHAHFPFPVIGTVHLKSVFAVHQRALLDAIIAGTAPGGVALRMVCDYVGLRPANGGKGVELYLMLAAYPSPSHFDVADEAKLQPLWTELIVIFKAGKAAAVTAAKAFPTHVLADADMATTCPALAAVDFANLPNATPRCEPQTVSPDDTWTYGVVSGDINPIHMSHTLARLFGQKGRIAHGIFALARTLAALPAGSLTPTWAVLFKGPIACGSRVEARGDAQRSGAGFDVYVAGGTRPNLCVRSAPRTANL